MHAYIIIIFCFQFQNTGSSVAQVDGAVYYTGGFPEGILALVRAAIANGDFSNIPGLTSVDSVIVEDSSGNVFGPPPDEVSPDDDSGVDSVRGQDPSQAERTSLSAGGYVGLAVAGLVVGLLVLFASRQRRRRNRDSPGRSLKHEQFHDLEEEASYEDRAATDGDSDEYLSRAETVPDIGERVPASDSSYHIANIVDEASLWENQSRNERFRGGQGLEVHAVEPTHSCSSPTCAVCRDKMEAPITFVTPGEPPRRDTARLSSRGYVASDTVQL